MRNKIVLITGITGQDGSYLTEFLLKKNYKIHGLKRRTSIKNSPRIDKIYNKIILHEGDITDSIFITSLINKVKPNEIYHLAAQSDVHFSFNNPEFTTDVNAKGTLNILEAVRILKMQNKVKIYQASTSELFGKVQQIPQSEITPFYPRSPYGVSKLYSYWVCVNYREAHNMFVCNGILFNHESERRGENFVTRKITIGLSNLAFGFQKYLLLGNLNAKRDWGHAADYVEVMWKMLQQKKPKDYVISSDEHHSVREFIEIAAQKIGIEIKWKNKGINEIGIIKKCNVKKTPSLKVNDIIIKVNKKYFRDSEVENLLGNSKKSRKELNWKPRFSFDDLVTKMIDNDYKIAKKKYLSK